MATNVSLQRQDVHPIEEDLEGQPLISPADQSSKELIRKVDAYWSKATFGFLAAGAIFLAAGLVEHDRKVTVCGVMLLGSSALHACFWGCLRLVPSRVHHVAPNQ
ncbi:MAG: hypothetical protein COT85_03655 [Chlamydiae bacterium CG10_big_fil_rev_8_21_14_0_10_42_34]|nr:MAG: hypothetical protein COT85_03655 [Chlamydiae bacterium CG10_big_fil_rev_8_21_14_0_10_42_34]